MLVGATAVWLNCIFCSKTRKCGAWGDVVSIICKCIPVWRREGGEQINQYSTPICVTSCCLENNTGKVNCLPVPRTCPSPIRKQLFRRESTPNLTPIAATPMATIFHRSLHISKKKGKGKVMKRKEKKSGRKEIAPIFQNEIRERRHESITHHPSRPQVLRHLTRNCQQSSSRHPSRYPRRLRPQHLC